ncbi:MAG: hypothetical protein WA902_04260 [Thermosynechococcaceae cyanobacterium]
MILILSLAIAGKVAGSLLSKHRHFQSESVQMAYARLVEPSSSEGLSAFAAVSDLDCNRHNAIA